MNVYQLLSTRKPREGCSRPRYWPPARPRGTSLTLALVLTCAAAGAQGGGAIVLGEGTYYLDRNRVFALADAPRSTPAVPSIYEWQQAQARPRHRTVLGLEGTRFTLNGQPQFLLGFSYYGGLGASEEFVRQDLEEAQRLGFNWLRLWATWNAFDHDVSAVGRDGEPREPFFARLVWLVDECDRRGLVVDVTLTRAQDSATGGGLPNFEAHRRAVEALVTALRPHRNWYLDLANERDVRDARYVSNAELATLRKLVRQLDPQRLVTASFGGHDLSLDDVRHALVAIGQDFLSPHRPRHAESPAQTAARTLEVLDLMRQVGRAVPVHHQEPFRRGYSRWEPVAEDFLADLRGALAGGASGWCFHNGSQRNTPDQQPRRSFDLRARRLFDQLDVEERNFVAQAGRTVAEASAAADRAVPPN